jgi:starch-binding outer membrane protein, SusD/RagB family
MHFMKQSLYVLAKTILLVFMAIVILTSCKKSIEVDRPDHLITSESVFADDKTAISAINGIYSRMMQNRFFFGSGAMTLYPGMTADELYSTYPDPTWDAFKNNTLLSSDGIIRNNIWKPAYFYIYSANACIEGLNKTNTVSNAVKRQLEGEAKLIRAFCYFYLVHLFGDVPLITTTDYRINSAMGRTSATEVKAQIEHDLKEAKELLSEGYASSGKVRPNKWSAGALLARAYLYQKEWGKAETEASEVIGSGAYSLSSNLNTVFTANSAEAIWQLMPVINNGFGNNTHEGLYFVAACSACPPDFTLQPSLVNAFETGDFRKENWVASKNLYGQTFYSPLKYKVNSNYPAAPTEYYTVLRLAEQFLISAEAKAEQNKISESLSDLNIIRRRAGLADTSISDKPTLIKAIMHERQVELFAEWGHRWFDLKRRNLADEVLGIIKAPNWHTTDILYPIPFQEIKVNPSLTQNAGY